MCACAGAALQRFMADELSRYPWRGLSALLGGHAEEFADDAESCSSQCFIDEVCRAHWKQHPSVKELRSPESQAKLLAIALQAQENIGSIERQHAGARRGGAVHEQTWSDSICFSSARHVLKHARAHTGGSSPDGEARARAQAAGLPTGGKSSSCGSQASAPPPKRRRIDRFNAWTAVNVVGRLVTNVDRERYAEEVRCPDMHAHYEQLANDMTRARDVGAQKPPRRTEGKHQLRKHRLRARRRKLAWGPAPEWCVAPARVAIREEAKCFLAKEATAKLAQLHERRARSAAEHREHEKAAAVYAQSQRQLLQDKLPSWLLHETFLLRGSLSRVFAGSLGRCAGP